MNGTIHERPGVYSSYDASSVISRGSAEKVIGIAACAATGNAGTAVRLHSYQEGVAVFGADEAQTCAMSTMLKLLFLGGASTVVAAAADQSGETPDYTEAFRALEREEDIALIVTDSAALTVQQALRASVESCSANRRERIAVVGGGSGERVEELCARAAELNSERVVLVGGEATESSGTVIPASCACAAVAAAIAVANDPAIPLNGTVLSGLTGVQTQFTETEIDTLVRGGVTALECVAGEVSPIRSVTTRTKSGGVADGTWQELTTILIVDDVIPTIREALRSRFARSKNTAQTRGAIRSETIVELERKLAAEIIDSYGEVMVSMSADDPTTCEVEFSFTVAHGLNRIYLTAHITV